MSTQYPDEAPDEKSHNPYAGRGSIVARYSPQRASAEIPTSRAAAANALPPVVYYIRRGDHIKIGYTANLGNRLNGQGGMNVLLAFEFGDRALERQRHIDFADHLVPGLGREVFYASPDLMSHIAALREMFGLLPLDDAA